MMTIATLAASVAVGGVVIQGILGGGNAALTGATGTAKTFVFCNGTSTADQGTSFTNKLNIGEFHVNMMTATTSDTTGADMSGLQLGDQRNPVNAMTGEHTGCYDAIVTWDAKAIGDKITFFLSANNITSVSVLGESSAYTDNTHCSFTFTGYPNSMTFAEGDAVTNAGLVANLGTGTTYSFTTSVPSGTTKSLATTATMSNVKTVAFQITAKQVGNTAHFQKFTVNWSC